MIKLALLIIALGALASWRSKVAQRLHNRRMIGMMQEREPTWARPLILSTLLGAALAVVACFIP